MIRLNGKWVGLDALGEEELAKLRTPQGKAVMKATLYFEGRIKEKLTGPRTGRVYGGGRSRGRGGKFTSTPRDARGRFRQSGHQASAPGEPPATWHGDLRRSITHGIAVDGDQVSGEVGTSEPKARLLEYGGMTGAGHRTRILPRPLWEPTWIEERDNIQAILDESVKV